MSDIKRIHQELFTLKEALDFDTIKAFLEYYGIAGKSPVYPGIENFDGTEEEFIERVESMTLDGLTYTLIGWLKNKHINRSTGERWEEGTK